MTQTEFDNLKVGDTIVRISDNRDYKVVAVHEGEGAFFQNVVFATRPEGKRRIIVEKETFTR